MLLSEVTNKPSIPDNFIPLLLIRGIKGTLAESARNHQTIPLAQYGYNFWAHGFPTHFIIVSNIPITKYKIVKDYQTI
jgi:hypothetical protein